ncbi:MAG: DUF4468 domain-containing protein [Bacteroidales bacterium]|nr:DUF4468 domain-containing protein [Bacteroidales bacterium]MBR2606777.1 DUF4468 domain-containing protein [Bacteroidaceae bacterium]
MKKIISLLIFILTVSAASAQLFKGRNAALDKPEYQAGAVPTVNGKVVFEENFTAKGDSKEILEKAQQWIKKRYSNPEIIKYNIYDEEKPGTIIVKSEEYITFKKKFFVLDRTRITYFLDIEPKENACTMRMYRITYWYDEEYKGGEHFTAEQYITDDEAFNSKKTKLLKKPGKFRVKTIDLKNNLLDDLKNALN